MWTMIHERMLIQPVSEIIIYLHRKHVCHGKLLSQQTQLHTNVNSMTDRMNYAIRLEIKHMRCLTHLQCFCKIFQTSSILDFVDR